ncbi:30S ribosomal protein S11 [Salsipaludibacter albus]|uniref:30S ribosomal protein S11 n=1 Tax=Salsipaludibacter albus TaxID=2849650 RepID=UPI001EE46B81|nr:30S ribosomal protein S11 [Salsipaludibacter albus]MBY5161590.1 30S ribosomal protein S11 [Salsipaludibacter albus]
MAQQKKRARKKERKNVLHAVCHLKATFNNTTITFADQSGNVIAWSTGGHAGFKGSRKSTPFAAQVAAEQATKAAIDNGVRKVDVVAKGPGAGRETAIRTMAAMGIEVLSIKDVTPVPHNGCRPPKRRRG